MSDGDGLTVLKSTEGRGGGPLLLVLPDPETLAHAVASAILAEAHRATKRSGGFAMALSGGTTPRRVYELLSQSPFEEEMPWAATEVYWSDERCVDPEDFRSNELMAREALLDHVRIPEAQVHPMRCPESIDKGREGSGESDESGGSQAAEAAAAYEKVLRARDSALDLVLLGLGEDGHTASLFPGSEALAEREKWVAPALGAAASGDDLGEQAPLWRITLTPEYINRAASVFFMVSGATKASAVRQTLGGVATDLSAETAGASEEDSLNVALPARLIRPVSGDLCWFLDEEAGSELDKPAPSASRKEPPQ